MSKKPPINPRISETEKAIRSAVCSSIAPYESEYIFHNSAGHFVERVLSHFRDRGNLASSVYLTLIGCQCKIDGLSIPCAIRREIEEKILMACKANADRERHLSKATD